VNKSARELAVDAGPACKRAIAYIRSRQCANGGFCFYRSEFIEEPNLHDTYHAVSALALTGTARKYADTAAEFIAAFDATEANALYYTAFTLDRLGRGDLIERRYAASIRACSLPMTPDAGDGAISGWLDGVLKLLSLKRRFAELPNAREFVRFIASLHGDGGYGVKPNLYDTYLCLSILGLLSVRVDEGSARKFLDRLQVPVLGFAATQDSTLTSLDVIDAGIRCCAMLNSLVRHASDALAFTLACQCADGGFSRTSGALPDLAQTHRALQIIHALMPGLSAWKQSGDGA
jgi:hypothetical protein